ncbi:phosphatase PAP2 family protein [Gordonia sp. HY285]|uniref:phosphatase PAP2 family protein n=1 Tax=Gordonia liuliyuniae TaxID=2911517 RepID=UPI001F299142|nr:phosphatase PAP2 family protein [Gordonia liuliyuniae]MCF8610560.1 phosphatase PAP2 family protein [Gordonia liuliyuniae]
MAEFVGNESTTHGVDLAEEYGRAELIQNPPTRRPSAVGAAAAAGAFVVVAVAAAIVARPLHDDRVAIRFVRRHQFDWLTDLARGYSAVVGPLTVVVLAAVGALLLAAHDRSARRPIAMIAGPWGAVAVSAIVKWIADRPRPPVGWQLGGPETTPAFPSTHVAGLTAMVLVTVLLVTAAHSRARWISYAIATCVVVAMAAARVYLCMTWASDAVGGLLLGVATGLGTVWVVDRMTDGRRASTMP